MPTVEELMAQILQGQNEIKADIADIKQHQQVTDQKLVELEAGKGANGLGAMLTYDPNVDFSPENANERLRTAHEQGLAGEPSERVIPKNKHHPGVRQNTTGRNWEGEMNRVLNGSPDYGSLVQSEHPSVIVIDNKEQHLEQLRNQQRSIITEY